VEKPIDPHPYIRVIRYKHLASFGGGLAVLKDERDKSFIVRHRPWGTQFDYDAKDEKEAHRIFQAVEFLSKRLKRRNK
jgi:hypothetical protein